MATKWRHGRFSGSEKLDKTGTVGQQKMTAELIHTQHRVLTSVQPTRSSSSIPDELRNSFVIPFFRNSGVLLG